MLEFARRNLRIFFRQKSAVFFSLLGVFIVIGLYVLFLGDVWISSLEGVAGAKALMSCWIIAGIVSITPVTTAMGAFQVMVEDRANGGARDFYASPMPRWKLLGGYMACSYLVALIMSLLSLALGEAYIVYSGGALLTLEELSRVLGIVLVSTLCSGSLVFLLVSFFSSNSAFSTASTVIGTLIGFITGIYLPVGNLPQAVQWVVKLFPVSHAGAALRQVMMKVPMEVSFKGAPAQLITQFEEGMGVVYRFEDYVAEPAVHLLVLVGSALVFLGIALWQMSRKKN